MVRCPKCGAPPRLMCVRMEFVSTKKAFPGQTGSGSRRLSLYRTGQWTWMERLTFHKERRAAAQN